MFNIYVQALLSAIKSGSNKFFLGTDSAPHPKGKKECPSGCAGCFTMPHALELYMMAFEEAGCIENFKKFAWYFVYFYNFIVQ